jgi:hypothetical protein
VPPLAGVAAMRSIMQGRFDALMRAVHRRAETRGRLAAWDGQ